MSYFERERERERERASFEIEETAKLQNHLKLGWGTVLHPINLCLQQEDSLLLLQNLLGECKCIFHNMTILYLHSLEVNS